MVRHRSTRRWTSYLGSHLIWDCVHGAYPGASGHLYYLQYPSRINSNLDERVMPRHEKGAWDELKPERQAGGTPWTWAGGMRSPRTPRRPQRQDKTPKTKQSIMLTSDGREMAHSLQEPVVFRKFLQSTALPVECRRLVPEAYFLA